MVKYEIDQAHTHFGFTAKHLAVSTVRGRFNKFEGFFESPDEIAAYALAVALFLREVDGEELQRQGAG